MIGSIVTITIVYLAIMLYVGFRAKKYAENSFASYSIADKNLPFYVLMFTFIASTFGAGNFIGHADQGYRIGLPWIAFVLGEQCAPIIFAFTLAKFASKYSFNTLAEFCDHLVVRDKITRAISGFILCLPGVAWVGGQAMGIGMLYNIFTDSDPTMIIIISALAFIVYTMLGGMYAVAWTDLLQGVFVVALGILFYFQIFGEIGFNFAYLGEKLSAIDPSLWSWSSVTPKALLTLFLTSFFGIMTWQVNWQRAFAARTPSHAKRAFIITGIMGMTFVPLTVFGGMVARVINPELAGGVAVWMMKNMMSDSIGILMFILILAATMSTADSLLNSAAVNIVNDIIKPYSTADDKKLIFYAQISTVIIGIFSLIAALNFSYILDLASLGYSAAGGAIFPFLVIGLLWKKDRTKEASWKNSMLTVSATRIALVVGCLTAIIFERVPSLSSLLGGGVIPSAIITSLLLVLVSLFTMKQDAGTHMEDKANVQA